MSLTLDAKKNYTTDPKQLLESLNFNVRLEPLFTKDGVEATKSRGVYRDDTEEIISVVGSRYSLVQHKDAIMPPVEKLLKEGWVFPARKFARYGSATKVERAGSKVYVEMWNPAVTAKIGNDEHHPRIVLYNSLDTSTRLGAIGGGYVVKCTNGMVAPSNLLNFTGRRHVGINEMDVERLHNLALTFMENYESVSQSWKRLSEIVVGEEVAVKAIEAVSVRKKDDIIERIEGTYLDEATGWDVFQGITNYLTHSFRGQTGLAISKQRRALEILDGEKV